MDRTDLVGRSLAVALWGSTGLASEPRQGYLRTALANTSPRRFAFREAARKS
jgi:hypothetical protein